jgi:PBP1b-binding outer membrane lipoprotein LpoB
MKKILFLILIIFALFAGCVSTDNQVENNVINKGDDNKETAGVSDTGNPDISVMKEYLENGIEKINYGSVSEGIEQLILVLAEKSKMKNPSKEAIELA